MRTKKDAHQIVKDEHSEKHNAKRVIITDTQMNVELDYKDGDSVTTHPAKLVASAMGVTSDDNNTEVIPPLDCSSLRTLKIVVDGSGDVEVYTSPVDNGEIWELEGNSNNIRIENLLARRIKVVAINVNGDVHLVGRS